MPQCHRVAKKSWNEGKGVGKLFKIDTLEGGDDCAVVEGGLLATVFSQG